MSETAAAARNTWALLLAGLQSPTQGSVRLKGADLSEVPEALRGRRLSYADQQAYFFPLSLRENLLYGLKHRPLRPAPPERDQALAAFEEQEAKRTGNTTMDIEADWVDFEAAGVADGDALEARMIELLRLVDLGIRYLPLGSDGAASMMLATPK